MTYRKKLIEVALPLDAINRESAREKSIRHGHPSTLHLWWARRPLAACRAVIFASLVDDPEEPGCPPELLAAIDRLPRPQGQPPTDDSTYSLRREKLFELIEKLVKWENTTNQELIQTARDLIRAATDGHPPPLLDPFCGGGSIPLEGQRLGLQTYASDLNPVAVLITKALIELPPRFAGRPPVNPESQQGTAGDATWQGASGLAADVRYYGQWMRQQAWQRIGHLYPRGPKGETVIAWLWARTVRCPNPACGAPMPLVRSFWLSTKKGKETWVEPVVDRQNKAVRFEVRSGKPAPDKEPEIKQGTKTSRGAKFFCLVCGQHSEDQHIKDEGMAGRRGQQLLAVVVEGQRSRGYLSPYEVDFANIQAPEALGGLTAEIADDPRAIWCKLYGLTTYADLFTPRQLVALTTFADLVGEARALVLEHSGGDTAYADAVATYLALCVSKLANRSSTICFWDMARENVQQVFARQAIPMTWDFCEANPFSESSGNWLGQLDYLVENLDVVMGTPVQGFATQQDAAVGLPEVDNPVVIADPPYYDNIGYSDLSDFFYVWLRRSLREVQPDLFSMLLTPKEPELVATPYRFAGDKTKARKHFEKGMGKAFKLMRQHTRPDYPVTLYYAFKQAEEKSETLQTNFRIRASTGWETMLQGLIDADFQVTGTWPVSTEFTQGLKLRVNALASSIVLACRPRPADAPLATRREFLAALRRELAGNPNNENQREQTGALRVLMSGRVAPVDLAQAAIGPGMAVFSRYRQVLEADGSPMTVRTALQEINYVIEDFLAQQEGDLDVESQLCVAWFQQYGGKPGLYGQAEVLATAKNVSVAGLERLGLLEAARGMVRLRLREGYAAGWDPGDSPHLITWEACQRLVWTLQQHGEREAGRLARQLGGYAEQARDLAYRLYGIADAQQWAEEALGYNALVASWPEIQKYANEFAQETQSRMEA